MSAVVTDLVSEKLKTTMTNISANARIDYIHRFSKQLVIAYADIDTDYSNVTSQFLASLPPEQNTAFISSSIQFNDIQIRSRIIEQLFTHSLFDPEQSLAVSIINLMRESQQPIAIVVEHAQSLSIQLLHELTQLAEIAKKHDKQLRVLLTGDSALGLKICENKVLFSHKVSIVCAQTGQVYPLNKNIFKHKSSFSLKLAKYKKWLFSFLAVILLSVLAYTLVSTNLLSSLLHVNKTAPFNNKMASVEETSTPVFADQLVNNQHASQEEIYAAISGKVKPEVVEQSYSTDVINALSPKAASVIEAPETKLKPITSQANPPVIINKAQEKKVNSPAPLTKPVISKTVSNIERSLAVYKEFKQAYVIQYAAFSQESVKRSFLTAFPNLDYLSYFRLLNGVEFEVLTSQPYASREQAKKVLNNLPNSLKQNGLWVKAISAINIEINHHQTSQ